VDGGSLKPANAAEAALLPIFPTGKKEGGFCYRSHFGDAFDNANTKPRRAKDLLPENAFSQVVVTEPDTFAN
jgi:hypothetical protein